MSCRTSEMWYCGTNVVPKRPMESSLSTWATSLHGSVSVSKVYLPPNFDFIYLNGQMSRRVRSLVTLLIPRNTFQYFIY